MTPDEASELGEFLWEACRNSAIPIHPNKAVSCCPLWAAFERGCGDHELGSEVSDSFILAFDGREVFGPFVSPLAAERWKAMRAPDPEAFALGQLFREHALSGRPW